MKYFFVDGDRKIICEKLKKKHLWSSDHLSCLFNKKNHIELEDFMLVELVIDETGFL